MLQLESNIDIYDDIAWLVARRYDSTMDLGEKESIEAERAGSIREDGTREERKRLRISNWGMKVR